MLVTETDEYQFISVAVIMSVAVDHGRDGRWR